MKLFHGTTEEAKELIEQHGFNTDLVFLTPRKDVAEDYGYEVVDVNVDEENLLIDLDMPGAIGVSVETANAYTGNDWTIDEYIDAGHSVCAKTEHVSIA
ncbi:hypothetical protein AAGW04_06875 [Pectobacterium aroidearum]|uniref:hypothetical protein n=1 Tax=Pectobacterium aroidearum TaxID=1201031 RepID=UPI003158694E